MTETERRHFSRIDFNTPVKLNCNQQTWTCTLVDISLKGALVKFQVIPDLSSNELFELIVPLSEGNNGVSIRMEVTLAHIKPPNAGFLCKNIDIESIAHLRRLMELNLGDMDLVNREIADLGKKFEPGA